MRTSTLAFILLAIVAVRARAEPAANVLPMKMLGSDTLHEVTLQVISICELTSNLDYQGTGSTNGGNAMRAHDQQVAPQSRFLNSQECSDFGTSPQLGQGVTIGLDGIGVYTDATEATSCTTLRYNGSLAVTERNGVSGLQCPNCVGNTYTFSDWRDVLRILYAGQSDHIVQDPCTDADPPRVPSALGGTGATSCGNGVLDSGEQCDDSNTTNFDGCASNCTYEVGNANRCNSDLRRELVSNWSNLFQNSCSDPECAQVRHAFRRDDASGTTDTFLTLLGLPQATSRTFCDGFENEDLDPIRVPCDPNEQVCETTTYAKRNANPNGGTPSGAAVGPAAGEAADLGLLLAVTMPADTDKQFQDLCPSPIGGAFRRAPMPFAITNEEKRCPDGLGPKLGCLWPATSTTGTFCLARAVNRPGLKHPDFQNFDARAYNLVPRDPSTGAILLPGATSLPDPRFGGGGFYRIHQTAPMANGAGTCAEPDATQQLGCLVNASPCSISYAGREALFAGVTLTSVQAELLRSPLNDPTHGFPSQEMPLDDIIIRRLLDPSGPANGTCGNGTGDNFGYRYPLARRLWINAARGFGLPNFSNIADVVDSNDADTLPDLSSMEKQLVICMTDRTLTDQAIVDNGFITVTDRNCSTGNCDPSELEIGYRARSCQSRCGDGVVQTGEACDDGNTTPGDGCNASCTGP